MHRVHSALGWLGIIGAVAWISLMVMAGDWGPSGSADYDRYETNSQLWVFAFALMACGFMGLFLRYRSGKATVFLGVWTHRRALLPRWAGWTFLLTLPATFVAAAVSLYPVPLCLAALAAGIFAVRPRPFPGGASGSAAVTGPA